MSDPIKMEGFDHLRARGKPAVEEPATVIILPVIRIPRALELGTEPTPPRRPRATPEQRATKRAAAMLRKQVDAVYCAVVWLAANGDPATVAASIERESEREVIAGNVSAALDWLGRFAQAMSAGPATDRTDVE